MARVRRRLPRWQVPAATKPEPRESGGSASIPASEQFNPPTPASTVLQDALAQSQLTDEMAAGLAEYRAAIATLESHGGARYRAGVLEAALKKLELVPIARSLGANVTILQELFTNCVDLVFRGVLIGGERPALLIFVDGMAEDKRIEQAVLEPLVRWGLSAKALENHIDLAKWLEAAGVTISQAEPVTSMAMAVDAVLGGDTVLMIDGLAQAVKLSSRGWQQRAVEEPTSEATIRGPREGFVESLRTNTMLIRRRIRSPHLKIERVVLGRRTRTLVDIVYLKDVTSPALIDEVRARLERIDIDGIIDTGTIEELIEDQPSSPFPQIANTERPDRVAGSLLDGQVAIISDGSPFALLLPITFWSLMQAGEDYYERFWSGTLLRWLRYLFAFLALLGPSLYIAITTFHQEMLPTSLLLSIAAARDGIPFPAFVEAFVMEIFFEALREAGVRLPRPVGQAVSIVGALVIGQAAVQAGLVSAPVVIIVAATGIASFTIPRFNLGIAVRLLRFPMMFLAGTLGIFGIMVGVIALLVHLCGLRSFGVPYMQPVAPVIWGGIKDVLLRAPTWAMNRRPAGNDPINPHRQIPGLRPGPGGSGP